MTRTIARRAPLAAAAVLALALAACGDGGTPNGAATTAPPTTATVPPSSRPPTSSATSPSGGAGCGLRTSPAAGTVVVTATVKDGKVEAPSRSVSVKRGTKVRLEITSDVGDEVHVHTYDLKEDVTPGCPSAIEFVANIPGQVEVELEKSHVDVLEIKAT
ncbi:MAG TPA: hypothetical protein VGX28_04430 [Frankiaceae bacterium]|nr:hypothetical protein [Frankiaceae bacterium]